MRRGNPLIVLAVLGLGAILLLGRGGGLNLYANVRHNFRWENPPTGLRTIVTTPRNRQWRIDRRIDYTPCPGPYCPNPRPQPWTPYRPYY